MQEYDVVGHHQRAALLVPAGTVASQDGDGVLSDLRADLRQMQVHHLGIRSRRDHRGTQTARGADRPEDVGVVVAVIANHRRPGAHWRPDVGMGAFLADPGFVLEPDLYRRICRGAGEFGAHQAGEVFLKASSAAGSFFGCTGRG